MTYADFCVKKRKPWGLIFLRALPTFFEIFLSPFCKCEFSANEKSRRGQTHFAAFYPCGSLFLLLFQMVFTIWVTSFFDFYSLYNFYS